MLRHQLIQQIILTTYAGQPLTSSEQTTANVCDELHPHWFYQYTTELVGMPIDYHIGPPPVTTLDFHWERLHPSSSINR